MEGNPRPVTPEPKLLEADFFKRKAAPIDVWHWQDYTSWKDVIWSLLDDVIDDSVRKAFLESPPEYVVSDDLGWLDKIVLRVKGEECDTKELLADRIWGHFRAFRAAHGTRLNTADSIYTNGLKPLEPDDFHEKAREIFLNDTFPELEEAHLQTAIVDVGTETREGHVYFEASEQFLINHCGHYMIYGSEYLLAIAAHLKGRRDYRKILKSSGMPTIFVCDIPLELLSDYTILEFAGNALAKVFQELLGGEGFEPEGGLGSALSIRTYLPSKCIVGHYHPVVHRDPLSYGC